MQSKTLKYLSYSSMAVLIAMMMAASVIEKLRGAETAQALIYHHPVFFVFWAVAAVSGLALLVRRIGWKRPATLAMHAAFVLILVGALVSAGFSFGFDVSADGARIKAQYYNQKLADYRRRLSGLGNE